MSLVVPCPSCGEMIHILQALEDKDGRFWVDEVMSLPAEVHVPLYRYLMLFKPPKQALRYSRMRRLTSELKEPIQAARIERNSQVYVVPLALWIDCMTELVETPPKSLRRPLKGHGYLLEMLASRAEKAAARAEQQREDKRRHRPAARDGRDHTQNFQSMKEALGSAMEKVNRDQ